MSQRRQSSRISSCNPVPVKAPGLHRECLVYGCREKTVWVKEDGRKIYSKHCFNHTCFRTVSIQDGVHCPMAKKRGDRFCENHKTCGGDNCRELGENPDGSYPWFCQQHRCTKPNCRQGAENLMTKRCKYHQECAALQCNSRPDRGSNSNFCKDHTCTNGTCSLEAVANNRCREHSKCPAPSCTRLCVAKGNGKLEPFCQVHLALKCAHLGCGRRKLRPERRYCHEHGCRLPSCEGERYEGGGTVCLVHKCTLDGCFEPIAKPDDTRSLFCIAHACRVDRCLRTRQHTGGLCEDHTCEKPGCHREVAEDNLCKVHSGQSGEPCKVDGCKNSAGQKGYCKGQHACAQEGCWLARLSVKLDDAEEDSVFCLKHDREHWARKAATEKEKSERDNTGVKPEGRKWRQAYVEDSEDTGDI